MAEEHGGHQPLTPPIDPDSFSTITGMDFRADWLLRFGVQDFLPDGDGTFIPFTMVLPDEDAVKKFRDLVSADGKKLREEFAGLLMLDLDGLDPERFSTGFALKSFFDLLRSGDSPAFKEFRGIRKEIKLSSPIENKAQALPPSSWVRRNPSLTPLDAPANQTVIMAVIDDGIAFAHERFRSSDGTSRVQCFWRQDGPFDLSGSAVEYGREICKQSGAGAGIDALLDQSKIDGCIDEDVFYRLADVIDYRDGCHKSSAWRIGHGTHVLDLAAGADPVEDVRDRPIIAVQLPVATTENTSGADLTNFAIDAVDYIVERAKLLSPDCDDPLPVVINFSYGLFAGPHDGTHCLECYLDKKIRDAGGKLRVILPSGNGHLSRTHADVRFLSGDNVVDLHWRVPPDNRKPSFLEIWLPCSGAERPSASRLNVKVTAPDGATYAMLGEGIDGNVPIGIPNTREFGSIDYAFEGGKTRRGLFRVSLHPTYRLDPAYRQLDNGGQIDLLAPHGVWTVTLQNVGLPDGSKVQAWIERNDTLYGFPRKGRQSYFDQSCYRRYDDFGRLIEEDADQPDCVVKRAGMISGIATGSEVIVAGGFLSRGHRFKPPSGNEWDVPPADYSAGGPITEPCIPPDQPLCDRLKKPDALLISDCSQVHAGVLAAGTRSGSRVAVNGTSVAAPQLARWVAYDLASGGPGDRLAVCCEADRQEGMLLANKIPLPAERGGCGRMSEIADLPIVKLER